MKSTKVLLMAFTISMTSLMGSFTDANTLNETRDLKTPRKLDSNSLRKIRTISHATLKARLQSRNAEDHKKNKAGLKTLRQTLTTLNKNLNHEVLRPDSLQSASGNEPSSSYPSIDSVSRRNTLINDCVDTLENLEMDFQNRRLEKKLKKDRRILKVIQGRQDKESLKRAQELNARINRHLEKKNAISDSHKPLPMKSKENPPDELLAEIDEGSQLQSLIKELKLLLDEPHATQQIKKVKALLMRTQARPAAFINPTPGIPQGITTRTTHR